MLPEKEGRDLGRELSGSFVSLIKNYQILYHLLKLSNFSSLSSYPLRSLLYYSRCTQFKSVSFFISVLSGIIQDIPSSSQFLSSSLCFLAFSNYYCRILGCSNSFLANVLILYPVKTPEKQMFPGVLSGYKIGTLTRNDLK